MGLIFNEMPSAKIHSLRFAIFVMGFTSIAWQILIIRELLVVFQGVELTIGIIFGCWLLLEATGCTVVRRRAETSSNPVLNFTALQLAIGLCAVAGIVFVRYFKFLFGIPMGQLLGYHSVLLISLLVLAPVTLVKGAMFPYACKNMDTLSSSGFPSSKVYIIEAAGAFTAGLLFVFYLIYRLDHIFLAGILLLLNFSAVFIYLFTIDRLRLKRITVFVCILLAGGAFVFSVPDTLNLRSSEKLWYEGRLLDARNSEYANIAALESEGQYTFFVNGVPFATVPEPVLFIEEQAHFPMLFHPDPKQVLVVSGGVGGLLNEIIKHPVEEVHYAEQDPLLFEFFSRYTTPLTERELSHPSVAVRHVEGMRYLRRSDSTFDVVIVNLPPPLTLQINRYFTKEFFTLVQSGLNRGGILAVSVPGSETFLSDELVYLNRLIYATLRTIFDHVRVIVGEENIFIASDDPAIGALGPEDLTERLTDRGVQAGLTDEWYIRYKMDALRFGEMEAKITGDRNGEINTNIFPRGVYRSMILHTITVSPSLVDILYFIDTIPAIVYFGIIAAIFIIIRIIMKKRHRFVPVSNAIATTGFASMLMYILLIVYFQVYYGHVYHYIGLLTALFMGGTALGAYLASRNQHVPLLQIELLIVAVIGIFLLASVSGIVPLAAMQALIFLCMTAMGTLTGMAYPVAVRMVSQVDSSVSIQPGKLYALDLFGAFFGAVLTAIVLLPSVGIHTTLLLVLLLKLSSAALIAVKFAFPSDYPLIIPFRITRRD